MEPAEVEFTHSMTVTRLNEVPDVTRPFSDEVWQAVRATAHAVDRSLAEQNVRLTMGGEPTFVGIDEPESLQWNLEALGPLKRTRGLALIRDLRQRTAPGGLLHFGQGKWYPGEDLPRWAFHCISRKDGVPVWENIGHIAPDSADGSAGSAQALAFLVALARRLQVGTDNILAAYNPLSSDDGTPDEPAGYVMPLRRRQPADQPAWSSQLWSPRPERLVLSYGDSPIGYRIPVEAMPFVAPDVVQYEAGPEAWPGQPIGQRVPLPAAPARRMELFDRDAPPDALPPLSADAATAVELVRPSLCVEPRNGRLHVFLPYVP